MALSALIASNGADAAQCAAELLPRSVADRLPFVQEAVEKKINTPQTSSCGRLFDAVASLIGLRQEVTYEGEAAMMLEAAAERGTRDDAPYGFSVCREGMGRTTDSKTLPICPFPAEGEGTPAAEPLTANELFNISPVPVIRSIVADLRGGVPKETIARRFHNGLVTAFATVAGCCARQAGIRTIALSGGSFQNALLLRGLTTALEAEGFHVIVHRDVPANDGGIALGQVFAALRRIQSVSV
jgi:hydrogenase maturation protein HypF